MKTFYETLTDAVNDIVTFGFDSVDRVARWVDLLRRAAREEMVPEHQLVQMLQHRFRGTYQKMVDRGLILKWHPGVNRYTLEMVRPALRDELSRRIAASAALIKLNREESIEKTMRRFSGWASSVPAGGTDVAQRAETKANVRKPLASLPFEERRVLIDQGHKFVSSLSATIAENGGAIAGEWHSQFRQPGYNARPDHEDRDHGKTGKVFLVRNSWAHQGGLVKPGPEGFLDDMTAAGEEPFCRCSVRYLYHLRSLPDRLLTERGRERTRRAA